MSDQISSTKQIITKVVRDVVQEELEPVNQNIEQIKQEQVSIKQEQVSIKQELQEIKDTQTKTLNLLTDMMGEIQASREEQQLLSHKVYDDHEDRLQTVETKLSISPA